MTGNADPSLVPKDRKRRKRLALATAILAVVPAIVTPGAGAVETAVAEPPTFLNVTPVVIVKVNGVRGTVVDYNLPLAQDTAGVPLPVLCDPPPGSTFPLGETTVNCTATDDQGVQAGASFVVRVLDDVAPPAPTDVVGRGDPKSVTVKWRLPASSDIAGTEIVRFPGAFVVFRGRGTTYTDADIRPGGSYLYRVATYDWAGNHAKAVDVRMKAAQAKLVEPQDWAQLTQPPLLAWAHVSGADYYNVQLWAIGSGSPRKVLSIWPTTTHLQLTSKWAFGGKSYGLAPGRYRWYVWPGLGAQSQARYGNLIGSHVFVVVVP